MALTRETMRPQSSLFDAPLVAPMKGNCPSCRQSVAVLKPTAKDVDAGDYLVQGECEICGRDVMLVVS